MNYANTSSSSSTTATDPAGGIPIKRISTIISAAKTPSDFIGALLSYREAESPKPGEPERVRWANYVSAAATIVGNISAWVEASTNSTGKYGATAVAAKTTFLADIAKLGSALLVVSARLEQNRPVSAKEIIGVIDPVVSMLSSFFMKPGPTFILGVGLSLTSLALGYIAADLGVDEDPDFQASLDRLFGQLSGSFSMENIFAEQNAYELLLDKVFDGSDVSLTDEQKNLLGLTYANVISVETLAELLPTSATLRNIVKSGAPLPLDFSVDTVPPDGIVESAVEVKPLPYWQDLARLYLIRQIVKPSNSRLVSYTQATDAHGTYSDGNGPAAYVQAEPTSLDSPNEIVFGREQDSAVAKPIAGDWADDRLYGTSVGDIFIGGDGTDQLYGFEDSDVLNGGGGKDFLYGGSGNDWLGFSARGLGNESSSEIDSDGNVYDGGTGNDVMSGSRAKDVFIFRKGDGVDFINTQGGYDELVLVPYHERGLAGHPLLIAESDVSFVRSGLDLVVLIKGDDTQDSIRIWGWFDLTQGDTKRLGSITLGTRTWYEAEITQETLTLRGDESSNELNGFTGFKNQFFGNAGKDILTGAAGPADALLGDSFTGGLDDDTLNGSKSGDTYWYFAGDGNDTIYEQDSATLFEDKLRFPSLRFASASFTHVPGTENLRVTLSDGGTVTMANWFTAGVNKKVEQFIFFDRTLTADEVTALAGIVVLTENNDSYTGTANNETVFGLNGVDTINGGAGADRLYGQGGNDTLNGGSGDDVLDGGEGNDTLDGGAGKDHFLGGAGDDTLGGALNGSSQDSGTNTSGAFVPGSFGNVYEGGTGNDTLRGTVMADQYVFNLGDGADTIHEVDHASAPLEGVDVLNFGPGISPSDITVSRVGLDLMLLHSNGTDRVTVKNWYQNSVGGARFQLERVEFADGSTWSAAEVTARGLVVVGTASNDVLTSVSTMSNSLYGEAGNDTLTGGSLSDILDGGEGVDVLNGGTGDDYLSGGGGNDTLDGGTGTDYLVGGAGDDTLGGVLNGSSLDSGTSTSGLFVAGSKGNIYEGGAGNDTLRGTVMGDQYLFNFGDGSDTITEVDHVNAPQDGGDVLGFGPGIQPADITVSRVGTNLILSHFNGTDKVTIAGWYSAPGGTIRQIETVLFNDGTRWDAATLTQQGLTLNGTAGVDTLTGLSNFENTLNGFAGNDTITGGGLADVMEGGDGNDTLNGGGSDDILQGGDGVDTLDGGAGLDYLSGGAGADTLGGVLNGSSLDSGTNTSGAFVAGSMGNTYEGGLGNDTLRGTVMADLYIFNLADGADTINEVDHSSAPLDGGDVLRFGPLIQPADISVSRVGTNLVLSHSNGTDKVTITSWYSAPGATTRQVEWVEFADGTRWDAATLTQQGLTLNGTAGVDTLTGLSNFENTLLGLEGNDTLNGGSLDDVLSGGDGNDTLDGGRGADYLFGGAGADTLGGALNGTSLDSGTTSSGAFVEGSKGNIYEGGQGNDILRGTVMSDVYVFNLGDGSDTINEVDHANAPQGEGDILSFGPGILPADISVSRVGTNLVLGHSNGTDKVTIAGWYSAPGGTIRQIETVLFNDGTRWDAATLTQQGLTLNGTAGVDTLTGLSNFENTLNGLEGNDTITGGALDDVLNGGEGVDVLDGGRGADHLIGGGGNDTLGGSFGGASGDSGLTSGSLVAGTKGNIYEGGAGNDTLRGTLVSDVYLFNLGDGVDSITEVEHASAPSGQVDVLRFGPDIAPTDITVTRTGTSLVLSHWNGLDKVTINNWYTVNGSTNNQIEQVEFSDGTTWFAEALTQQGLTAVGGDAADNLRGVNNYQNSIYGGAGNDLLYGGNLDDFMEGGDGDDFLQGYEGRDTYIGGAGNDFLGYSPTQFGYGSSPADEGYSIGSSEPLPGAQGNVYIGGTGNDKMSGTMMSDSYYFNLGDGHDTIVELDLYVLHSADVIYFGSGINPSDIVVRYTSNNYKLSFNHVNGTDSVTLIETGYLQIRGIERVQFADGTVWDYEEIWNRASTIYGSEGNDTIYGVDNHSTTIFGGGGNDTLGGYDKDDVIFGGAGNDTISNSGGRDVLDGGEGNDTLTGSHLKDVFRGGAGDDTLGGFSTDTPTYLRNGVVTLMNGLYEGNEYEGGAGNDRLYGTAFSDLYLLNAGDGYDTISEYEVYNALGGQLNTYRGDTIRIGDGVLASETTVSRSGNNLVLTNSVSGVGATVNNWYSTVGSTANQIERVEFADGTVWTSAYLTELGLKVNGSSSNETLTGLANYRNTINGNQGNDTISGGSLADDLYGGEGNDTLTGGAGNDILQGGGGNDILNGSAGDDTFVYYVTEGLDTVTDTAGVDTLFMEIQAPLQFWRQGDDLRIEIGSDTQGVVVKNQFRSFNDKVEVFYFGGSGYSASQVESFALVKT